MAAPKHKSRVLCFGRDLDLLRTRTQVLARKYDAVELSDVDELECLPAEPAFDLVLLCHSVSLEDCRTSAEIVRDRWPQAKVMALTTGASRVPYGEADAVIMSLQGPVVLLRAIDLLMQQSPRTLLQPEVPPRGLG